MGLLVGACGPAAAYGLAGVALPGAGLCLPPGVLHQAPVLNLELGPGPKALGQLKALAGSVGWCLGGLLLSMVWQGLPCQLQGFVCGQGKCPNPQF